MTETKEKTGDKKSPVFKLPKGKLIAAPIKRIRKGTPVSHETSFKFKNAYEKIGLPMINVGGRGKFVNPFNSDEEREYLEKVLGEDLNFNREGNDFLANFRVKLGNNVEEFDLSDPIDYLSVLILKQNKDRICTDPEERMNKATYMWILSETGFQEAEREELGDRKVELYAYYDANRDNKRELIDFLKLRSLNPPLTADLSWLRARVFDEIEGNPTQSYIIITDPDKKYKILFEQALEARAIFYSADEGYVMKGRSIPFATNKANALIYFKEKRNQEDVAEIKALIEQYNKK